MEIQVLGAHQWDSAETRSTSILVDGVLALDAGCLATMLTLPEQEKVQAILLSHYHYDHIKDLGAYGFNSSWWGTTTVVCPEIVRDAVLKYILNGVIWLDLTKFPSPEQPSLRFKTIEPGQAMKLNGFEVKAFSGHHSVPIVGYLITGRDGKRLLFTSDTGRCWTEMLEHESADLVITEVTYPNGMEELADLVYHQTPAILKQELLKLQQRRGRLPRVVVIHVTPQYESTIRAQVADLATELGAEITVGSEGLRVSL